MTDGFNRYWRTMIRFVGNYTQMFSLKLKVLLLFNKSRLDSKNNYLRRGIFVIIFFITGICILTFFAYILNYFETKSTSHMEKTVIHRQDNYNLEIRNVLNVVMSQNVSYCNISRCKTVICSSIPPPLDSGKEASIFLQNTFKTQCFATGRVKSLIFQNSNFPNNVLGPTWLKTNLSIDGLSFKNCELKEIHDDAFSLPFYSNLKSLSLIQNQISILRKIFFKTLVNLESLIINSNIITYAESNLLENLASSLQTLTLDSSIKNFDVLKNITGQNLLPKIEILSIQGNSIPLLTSNLFEGVSNVKSIYVDNSEIKDLNINVFQPVAKSIEQLFMRSNNIKNMKKEVLYTILKKKSNFCLNIDNNPWHCDCSMKWMQDLMQIYPDIIVVDPICRTPETNADVSFTKANFCNESETPSSTTPTTITSTTTTSRITTSTVATTKDETEFEKLNITCDAIARWFNEEYSYNSLRNMKYEFTRLRHFFITEMANGSVLVNTTNAKFGFTLIWFSNQESMLSSENMKNNVRCIVSNSNLTILNELKPATSYTVCLLEAEVPRPSPLNCLALFTKTEYHFRAWLSNGDKPLVISLTTIIILIFSITSAVVSYIVIRRNPTLLRGSKRVLIVRRRTVNVVVLPEGVQVNSRRNTANHGNPSNLEDHDYFTPLGFSQRGRKDSQRSVGSSHSSGASYISGIEPNLLQLATWRIHRLRNINSQEVEKTPPIPPNHPVDTPPLSYDVV